MHGYELLASQVDGFAEVSSGLKHAHYIGWLHCSLRRVSFPHASQHHPGTESTDDQSAPCTASQFSPNKGSSPSSPTLTCNLVAACSSAHAVHKPGACSEIWEFAGPADFDDLAKQPKSKLLQAYHNMPQLLRHAPTKAAGGALVSAAAATHDPGGGRPVQSLGPRAAALAAKREVANLAVRLLEHDSHLVSRVPIPTHEGSIFLSLLATCPFCGDVVVGIRHVVEHGVHMQDIRSPVFHLTGTQHDPVPVFGIGGDLHSEGQAGRRATSRVALCVQIETV